MDIINDVKSAVCTAIKDNFIKSGNLTDFKIYKNQTVKNMVFPCFFVQVLETKFKKELGDTLMADLTVNIRYHPHPDKLGDYTSIDTVVNYLYLAIQFIRLPAELVGDFRIVRGKNIELNRDDNTPQMFITYSVRLKKQKATDDLMQRLDYQSKLKGE